MKAIVVGAGIVGSSVAYRLAQKGVDVTVLEKSYIGAGTSGTTFAWTNANRKPPRPYYDLNRAGMAAHIQLSDELGGESWFKVTGNLEWVHSDEDRRGQQDRMARLLSWGYNGAWIDSKALHELEPDVDLNAIGDAQIAYFPDEGLVNPVQYSAAVMGEAIRKHGTKLKLGVVVKGFNSRDGRIISAKTMNGSTYEADVFVNCSGRWINEVTQGEPRLSIPMAPTLGYLVYTPPAPTTLSRPLHAPDVNMRPDGSGRLMLRSNECDESVTSETLRDPCAEPATKLMNAARRVLPCLGDMQPEAVRIGLRSIPADDLTVVGRPPGTEGYYICVTHSGVTLAPILGQIVADEITGATSSLNLMPFRPSRFSVEAQKS